MRSVSISIWLPLQNPQEYMHTWKDWLLRSFNPRSPPPRYLHPCKNLQKKLWLLRSKLIYCNLHNARLTLMRYTHGIYRRSRESWALRGHGKRQNTNTSQTSDDRSLQTLPSWARNSLHLSVLLVVKPCQWEHVMKLVIISRCKCLQLYHVYTCMQICECSMI